MYLKNHNQSISSFIDKWWPFHLRFAVQHILLECSCDVVVLELEPLNMYISLHTIAVLRTTHLAAVL